MLESVTTGTETDVHEMVCSAVQSLESCLATSMEERERQLGVQRRLQRRYYQLTLISSQPSSSFTTSSSMSSSSSRRTGSRCSTSSTESTESSGIGDSLSISCPSSDESGQSVSLLQQLHVLRLKQRTTHHGTPISVLQCTGVTSVPSKAAITITILLQFGFDPLRLKFKHVHFSPSRKAS